MSEKAIVFFIGLIFIALLSFSIGASAVAYQESNGVKDFVIPIWNALGSWVSGVGALVAAGMALHIAKKQEDDRREGGKIKCQKHARAIIVDVTQRVSNLRFFIRTKSVTGDFVECAARLIEDRFKSLYSAEFSEFLDNEFFDELSDASSAVLYLVLHSNDLSKIKDGGKRIVLTYDEKQFVDSALEDLIKSLKELKNSFD